MTVTTLDPQTALVIIDLQNGIVAYPTAHPTGEVVAHARALAEAFRRRGLPVVLVNVTGGAPGRAEQSRSMGELPAGWADLVPELERQPQDHAVTKRTWGAFTNTDLDAYLKKLGVSQVVIVGIATRTPRASVTPRSALSSEIAATGPGCGGTNPCIADRPARAGIPTAISDSCDRRATR